MIVEWGMTVGRRRCLHVSSLFGWIKAVFALSSSITVFGSPLFSDLERVLNLNLGQEEEFSPLQGQCFEYTDRE